MKEIVLDTETTGMDPVDGHKIIEIGAVELENHMPTGKTLQIYINPERDIPPDATAVHGITDEFVKNKPIFAEVYSEFMEFIEGGKLIIHNAEFDMKFINYELAQVGHKAIGWANVVDTLAMARKKFPGSPANLDALCRRFDIDNAARTYHGALLDSELLAEVYLELLGGRQRGLGLAAERAKTDKAAQQTVKAERVYREPRAFEISADEKAAHDALLEKIKEPLWEKQG